MVDAIKKVAFSNTILWQNPPIRLYKNQTAGTLL
jgi:hypothetical protein